MAKLIVATKATAMKRGRNPKFPWVPVLIHEEQWEPHVGPEWSTQPRQEQIRGVAYADRAKAVAVAEWAAKQRGA